MNIRENIFRSSPRVAAPSAPVLQMIAAILLFARLTWGAAQTIVPDDGWRLWPDVNATWKDDRLYLPDETTDLTQLPVNPPSGGWEVLDGERGVGVTLPSTVEQHFWGAFGLRPYTPSDYGYAAGNQRKILDPAQLDADAQNGNYEGVSWWWQSIDVPESFRGKVVLLHIPGARQRAEVYVNHQLVGYDMIAETSFDCDVSKAIRPGQKNTVAIRITNPGGRLDWMDFTTITWGKYEFQCSQGFGGLDRGIALAAHDAVYLQDIWALNTPQVRAITAHATVRNTTAAARQVTVRFDVGAPGEKTILATAEKQVQIPAGQSLEVEAPIACPQAELWELSSPHLYQLQAHVEAPGDHPLSDDAARPFGFRWFEPRGIGQEAGLYLNDQRIRLYTAISWGYWGLNGKWPTEELAEKEVRAAKQLNLNMLNFHRDIGKEIVLARQDELGLLRYMEPGGAGQYFRTLAKDTTQPSTFDTSGNGGAPSTFAERYLEAKVVRMVRQFRGHPSLAIYVLQNETEPDFSDPRLFYLLRKVHELDPSRVVAAKSGISPNDEAWFAPYAADPMTDDGTGYCGWHDTHTVGGPGNWQDNMYRGPHNFTHQSDDRKEIVDWGEMLGAAVADNHPLMVEQIKARGGKSYDLKDHEELAEAYRQFLDKWGFREAFPSDESFYRDLGNKQYEFWGRVIEAARLSESNDILSISGWESTAIENHSGLVDNLRNFHGDPALIASKLAPLLPVVALRSSVLETGDVATTDIYLLNETGHPVAGNLRLTMTDPDGATRELGRFAVPDYVNNQFVYPIKMDLKTPALGSEGRYTFEISLDSDAAARNSQRLLVIGNGAELRAAKVGVIGDDADAAVGKFADFPPLKLEPYRDGGQYDLIVAASFIVPRKTPVMATGAPTTKESQPVEPPPVLTDGVLQRIRQGTPLLVLVGDEPHARVLAKELADAGAFQFLGSVPTARASWMGNWIFVRAHPLFAGLPINEVMKGDYQVSVKSCYGLLVDDPNVQIVAAYGRDHDRNIGAATFTAKLGTTPIVFQGLSGMHPVIEKRWLANAVATLLLSKRDR